MPDRVFIDSGSNTPISTDYIERSGNFEHVQYMKLMSGVDGSSEVISGSSTYGLVVNQYGNSNNYICSSWNVTNSGINVAWTADATYYRYVSHISVMNSDPNTGSVIRFCDGDDNTGIKYQGYAGPGGGGFANSFNIPIRFSKNTQLTFRALTSGANLWININGFNSSE